MKNKYQQVQSLISVTPEMEQRIVARLAQADYNRPRLRKPAFFRFSRKAVISVAACFALAVCIVVAVPALKTSQTPAPPVENSSPVVDYKSLSDLAMNLPFPLYVPAVLPEGYKLEAISALFGETAQLSYTDGTNRITFRMTERKGDVSGEYNEYAQVESVPIDGGEFTLKGSNGLFSIAIWVKDGYSFSVSAAKPLSREVMVQLAEGVAPYASK
ncbi:DUF4367 domain-containing protein [Paenibacillus sp. HW567]|uniref:DUF4367 domain-containing protein n=1 Tax=Paenibacillus sp. HW567 TaxID=1034769 RepID=UPI0003676334|nr:DUF4367 domain-containing protein [Paenibacillus sp. HW567]